MNLVNWNCGVEWWTYQLSSQYSGGLQGDKRMRNAGTLSVCTLTTLNKSGCDLLSAHAPGATLPSTLHCSTAGFGCPTYFAHALGRATLLHTKTHSCCKILAGDNFYVR